MNSETKSAACNRDGSQGRGPWAAGIAAPIPFAAANDGGGWPDHARVCPDSQVGSCRRTSAPHDRERFTWRRLLRLNAPRSLMQVRTPVRRIHAIDHTVKRGSSRCSGALHPTADGEWAFTPKGKQL